jgi:hypothetical protein
MGKKGEILPVSHTGNGVKTQVGFYSNNILFHFALHSLQIAFT